MYLPVVSYTYKIHYKCRLQTCAAVSEQLSKSRSLDNLVVFPRSVSTAKIMIGTVNPPAIAAQKQKSRILSSQNSILYRFTRVQHLFSFCVISLVSSILNNECTTALLIDDESLSFLWSGFSTELKHLSSIFIVDLNLGSSGKSGRKGA